jgi:3-oxoacyl-[acyl-carrier-protein] synthase-3
MSLEVNYSEITGIAAAVPKKKTYNSSKSKDKINLFNHIGVKSRHVNSKYDTSILCCIAAEKLLKKLRWSNDKIGFIIFVSQTRDHILPQTSCKIQEKLKLNKNILTLDLPMGCSGFVNGLYIAKTISSNMKKNGLLMCGDIVSKLISKNDQKISHLFGDCGTAIAIKYSKKVNKKSYYLFGTDGAGFSDLIYKSSGLNSYINKDYLHMNGAKIFEFAMREVPTQINKILKENKLSKTKIDYVIFHQASKFIIKNLSNKLNFDEKKILYSIENFGNTNSASIPLTMLLNKNSIQGKRLLLCGFGVGLTWSTAIIKINKLDTVKLIKF